MTCLFVRRQGTGAGGTGVVLEIGANLYTAEEAFEHQFSSITSLERDLLTLAATIFAVDRGIQRGEREEYARSLEVSVPIVNAARLQPLIPLAVRVLRTLSNDRWRVSLRQEPGAPEENLQINATNGQTLLFSGGLDSLAAALEFGRVSQIQLVSHVTRNRQIRATQAQLVDLLTAIGLQLPHLQFFVSSHDAPGFDHDIESTQRTRSFLFLVLGALVARRLGHREILMLAENGQMAVHLPLSQARIGAFSTHTAHPDVLNKMQSFLNQALGTDLRITNPYVSRTKAESIRIAWDQLRNAIPVANSCWRQAHLPEGASHCGECIPCIVRRIAIEYHGVDETVYARDTFSEDIADLPPEDEARRNLFELCEFMLHFERDSDPVVMDGWPELLSPNVDARATIEMYRRAAGETRAVLSRYPKLAPILQ